MRATTPGKRHVSDSLRSALFATAMAAGVDEVASAGSISGTVLANGTPVVGVDMTLSPTGGVQRTTVTDAQGKYLFGNLGSGCYRVKASSSSFGSYFLGDTIIDNDQVILDLISTVDLVGQDFQPLFGRSMAGVVRIVAQDPPDEVRVGLATPEGNRTAVEIAAVEGSPGEYPFLFANVPQGDWIVYARGTQSFAAWYHGDTASVFDATVTTVAASNVTGLEIDLPATPVVVATVRDENGDPLVNHVVTVFQQAFSSPSGLDYTDLTGTVRIPLSVLSPGSQVLVNSYGGSFQPLFGNRDGTFDSFTETFVLAAGDNPVTLFVPDPQGSVSADITEAGSGTGIAFAQVELKSAVDNVRLLFHPWRQGASFTGDWSINAGVPPGWYALVASNSSGYHVPETSPAFFVGSGQVTQNIDLAVGGRANVTVQGVGGPAIGARVRLFDENCEWVDTGFSGFGGIYFSPNVPVGNYVACVEGVGFQNRCSGGAASCQGATAFAVAASATTNTQIDVVPRTVRRVSGTLRDAAGNPIPFALIAASGSAAEYFFFPAEFVFTDECGDFVFEALPGATFSLSYSDPDRGSVVASGTIGNTNQQLDLTLAPYSSAVWGKVTDDENNPLQDVRLCLDTEEHCVESDSQGYYRLGAQPGTHRLWATGKQEYDWKVYPALQIGASPLRQDVPLDDVPADPYEANDLTNTLVLNAGIRYDRSFSSAEDVDLQTFNAQQGKYYRIRTFGTIGGNSQAIPNVGLFDEATKTIDRWGAQRLLEGSFTPGASGTHYFGVSRQYAGSYGIELTESDTPPGTPTPTVASVSPTSGPAAGGTPVTITGTDFEPNATVWFGTQWATNVNVVSPTTITCTTPSLGAGALYDIEVDNPESAPQTTGPRRPAVSGTLPKAWFADFGDVPQSYLFHGAVEAVFRAGVTTGCGGGNYCPNEPVTRDAMAVFILRGKNGGAFLPPVATGNVLQDVTAATFLARWMEQFFNDGITTGCGTSPGAPKPNYCPTGAVTRDGMSVFLLRGKNGSSFLPPVATGTVFADVTLTTFLARWMEGLEDANITQGCGGGNYCPLGLVSRGEMASFIRRTFGL